jgi:hopanoid biosynthesis associated protein HpnK
VQTGINIFLRPSVQRQVAAEIRAQLEAFQKTGLPLDHVNGHHHFHQHPTVMRIILELSQEFGIKAVRVPYEPFIDSWRARGEGLSRRLTNWLFPLNRTARMKRLLKAADIRYNDTIFGLNDSGRMNSHAVQQFLAHLPEGVSELYCHPATSRWTGADNLPTEYLCEQEFRALVDVASIAALQESGARKTTFTALLAGEQGR